MSTAPIQQISQTTPEEEAAIIAQQHVRNRLVLRALVALILGLVLFTILILWATGYQPFAEQDLFRSV